MSNRLSPTGRDRPSHRARCGAHRATVLLGIAATCARLGVDFEAYLTWVFIRRGTDEHKYRMSAGDLTPAAYKRAHPTRAG